MVEYSTSDQVKVTTVLKGDYAKLLIYLKTRGRIRTYTDGVYRSLDLLLDKTTAQDLQLRQAGSLEEEEQRMTKSGSGKSANTSSSSRAEAHRPSRAEPSFNSRRGTPQRQGALRQSG